MTHTDLATPAHRPQHSAPQPPAPLTEFAALGVLPELLSALQSLGYQQPTPVQTACLKSLQAEPQLDLMVSSQTGSGKTAAFLLPVITQLWQALQNAKSAQAAAWKAQCEAAIAAGLPAPAKPKRKNPTAQAPQGRSRRGQMEQPCPRALVLCPTRELAQQVSKQAIALVQHLPGLRVATVTGGTSYSVQLAALQNVQLLVATPGRLLDLHNSGAVSLKQVQSLVLDEADRMLDLGFAPDVQTINEACAQRQQTLMFSATLSAEIEGLAASLMDQPKRLTLHNAKEAHRDIDQVLHWADDGQHQMALLDHYLRDAALEQAIVFTRTQIECESLAQTLQEAGHSACSLHGAQSQGLRNRHMTLVRNGRVRVLVATDVAARGIDVPNISHVFNYGLPQNSEDYTHRIGRTGRAGRSGRAISLVRLGEQRRFGQVFQSITRALKVHTISGLEPSRNPVVSSSSGKRSGSGFGGRQGERHDRSGSGGTRSNFGDKRSFGTGPTSGDKRASGGKRSAADKPPRKLEGYDRYPAPAKTATYAVFREHTAAYAGKRPSPSAGNKANFAQPDRRNPGHAPRQRSQPHQGARKASLGSRG